MSQVGFSAGQVSHAAAIVLDMYQKGKLDDLGIYSKPLLKRLEANRKKWRAGKDLSFGLRLKRGNGGVNDGVKGFSSSQKVNFYNPNGAIRSKWIWREHHIGWEITESELKQQGIIVGDEFDNLPMSGRKRDAAILHDVLVTALADFDEQYEESMNFLLWGDGSADPQGLAGMRHLMPDVPTLGQKGGIDLSLAQNARFRTRARTGAFAADASFDATHGGDKVTSSPTNGGVLLQTLQYEFRQQRKYGGNPDIWLAGSDFIDALETERRANGQYSDSGFNKTIDSAVGETPHAGLTPIYDPTLDDIGRSKFAYIFDSKKLCLYSLEGDWRRTRNSARPYNQFVAHKSLISTGQMVDRQPDAHLVIEIS